MQALLNDLLDFNRTRFGLGINVDPAEIDLAAVFADEVQQLRVAHPKAQLELSTKGEVSGSWDQHRLAQLLSNLVVNALKYGHRDTPVRIELDGRETKIFAVRNQGPPIAAPFLSQIFDPLKRGTEQEATSGRDGSLGLGLYISRGIATAHGGDITVKSDERETVFTVRLPRRMPAESSRGSKGLLIERRIADRRMGPQHVIAHRLSVPDHRRGGRANRLRAPIGRAVQRANQFVELT